MGTNYYLQKDICRCCNTPATELHIGKSSAGWCFTVRIYPEWGINSLADWVKELADGRIVNEYGDEVTVAELLAVIIDRSWPYPIDYPKEYLDQDGVEVGPNNLFRYRVGDFCVRHGIGTWDYVEREFS